MSVYNTPQPSGSPGVGNRLSAGQFLIPAAKGIKAGDLVTLVSNGYVVKTTGAAINTNSGYENSGTTTGFSTLQNAAETGGDTGLPRAKAVLKLSNSTLLWGWQSTSNGEMICLRITGELGTLGATPSGGTRRDGGSSTGITGVKAGLGKSCFFTLGDRFVVGYINTSDQLCFQVINNDGSLFSSNGGSVASSVTTVLGCGLLNGHFVLVYTKSAQTAVYARRYDASGNSQGSEVTVINIGAGSECVLMDICNGYSDGSFSVLAQGRDSAQRYYLSRFSQTLSQVHGAIDLCDSNPGGYWYPDALPCGESAQLIAALSNGDSITVGNSSTGSRTKLVRVTSAGSKSAVNWDPSIADNAQRDYIAPAIIAVDNTFIVAMHSGNNTDLRLTEYANDGTILRRASASVLGGGYIFGTGWRYRIAQIDGFGFGVMTHATKDTTGDGNDDMRVMFTLFKAAPNSGTMSYVSQSTIMTQDGITVSQNRCTCSIPIIVNGRYAIVLYHSPLGGAVMRTIINLWVGSILGVSQTTVTTNGTSAVVDTIGTYALPAEQTPTLTSLAPPTTINTTVVASNTVQGNIGRIIGSGITLQGLPAVT